MNIGLNQEQNQIIQNAIEVFYPQYKNIAKIFEKSPCLQEFKDGIKSIADTFAPVKFYIQDCDGEDLIISNNEITFLTKINYSNIAFEIFKDETYKLDEALLTKEKYTVLDIGTNRGYAALYFAQKPWCDHVYGFELMPETYKYAQKTIELNKELKYKIQIFNIGLGNSNEIITAYYLPHADWVVSLDKSFIEYVASGSVVSVGEVQAEIKKSSEVLKEIIEENNISNIILKIDVEGAEYDIVEDLSENYPEIFDKIEIIIGEAHKGIKEMAKLSKTFAKFGFYLHSSEHNYLGQNLISQFLYVKI